ncbi:MAG: hypothetical protein BWK73_26780 [Thiothrix lacustris]|uniref:DNA binding HTH domain-containing protein n=1 Tax=Thiothrix lacustris TaxID=525917 RepID=A0A1Y1QKG4_9GAMM|nr:MAG: hypothetical protein BWK73_26780 [Thiothrix lacustris]
MSIQFQQATAAELQTLLEAAPDDISQMNIYQKLKEEMEKPLLEGVMKWAHGNQSQTAIALGINRATLRTKLKRHHML